MSKLVSIKDASKATGLSYRFLHDKIVKGEYPAIVVGSERKIHKVNVDVLWEFINQEQMKNVKKAI